MDLREHWTPTADNLFMRVGKPMLLDWIEELISVARADEQQKATRKVLAETLEQFFKSSGEGITPEQLTKREQWMPECLQVVGH